MKVSITALVDSLWYGGNPLYRLLLPLSLIYRVVIRLRRFAYASGIFSVTRVGCPLVVVGNISVGGTGKTPLVIWLGNWLVNNGWRPGIITRGYGGSHAGAPVKVVADSDPAEVGDEAVLLARRTGLPVAVCASRIAAGQTLLSEEGCDILISDDGLQHYAMGRDVEIVVIDGGRLFGNSACLPAGPLREPVSRLAGTDLRIYNGCARDDGFSMQLSGSDAVNLQSGARYPLNAFARGPVHALAAIGNPERFFDLLRSAGLDIDCRVFRDHHPFVAGDLQYDDEYPVLMTEKDAVKCAGIGNSHHWFVPVEADPGEEFSRRLQQLLSKE